MYKLEHNNISPESLIESFHREKIGTFPTPVRKILLDGGKTFWLKDDGVCQCIYGGNKIRKLEYLLPYLAQSGKKKLIIKGDAGSHTVTACAIYGKEKGFDITAVIFPYKNSNMKYTIKMLEDIGVTVRTAKNLISAMILARFIALAPNSYLIPFSATTPISTLGYVNAAFELVNQIETGDLPQINKIFISFATGGTVAGLLVGFALKDFPIKIVAVQTTEAIIGNKNSLRHLVSDVLKLLGRGFLTKYAMERLEILDTCHLGGGYRSVTPDGEKALKKLQSNGLYLDLAFTAKTMAALLKILDTESNIKPLFWNTHNQNPKYRDL